MKNYSIIVFAMLVIVNIYSCRVNNKVNEKENNHSFLDNMRNRDNYYLPDSIINFFPDYSDNFKGLEEQLNSSNAIKSDIPYRNTEFVARYLLEIYETETNDILKIYEDRYNKKTLIKVKSENEDYFIIGSERDLSKTFDTIKLKDKYLFYENKPIILNFHRELRDAEVLGISGVYDSTTISGIASGYEILILKSGNEYILPEKYYYEWDVLPKKLKHGYRSGVAFKEGEAYIIYWAVAW